MASSCPGQGTIPMIPTMESLIKKGLSITSIETRRSAAVRDATEFEGLGESNIDEAHVFTLQ